MREKWKKKRSRRLRRKRRKMRARSSTCTSHTIAKHANHFRRVNAPTSVLAYVTSRSSVQIIPRRDEHGVRSIRHFFHSSSGARYEVVVSPTRTLCAFGSGCARSYRLLVKCGRGCSMGRVNKCLDILSKIRTKAFFPTILVLSEGF